MLVLRENTSLSEIKEGNQEEQSCKVMGKIGVLT